MRTANFYILSVIALLSVGAHSENQQSSGVVYDASAFARPWSGRYYVEPAEKMEPEAFDSFEKKAEYYLNSPRVAEDDGEDSEEGFSLRREQDDEVSIPEKKWSIPYELPLSAPIPWPSPFVSPKPQAQRYYDRGTLQNASDIGSEGKGYVKVLQDRDERIGGRGWGTRSLVELLRRVAADFADRFPGRERLQIGDIARKKGGPVKHGSHQNGLDADIIYIRKNRMEQARRDVYGRNGFAEQFVIASRPRRSSKSIRVVSANFDTDANFNLIRMFSRSEQVQRFFMDRVLVREFFRYAESHGLAHDPEVQAMLMKLKEQPSHADHFHVRLFCQPTDTKCVSSISPRRKR